MRVPALGRAGLANAGQIPTTRYGVLACLRFDINIETRGIRLHGWLRILLTLV